MGKIMKRRPRLNALTRRERQIMDILYQLERATVGEVLSKLADKTNYSTVRAQLRVLEEKGHIRHEEHGLRYVYVPCVAREVARRSALRHLVETFFEGSTEKAVAALLGGEVSKVSSEELERIAALYACALGDRDARQPRGDHRGRQGCRSG
jgi:BlaI family transcriptional regulator, penicillinase repressor